MQMPSVAQEHCYRQCSHSFASSSAPVRTRAHRVIRPQRLRQRTRAEAADDADFDKRLDSLRKGKAASSSSKTSKGPAKGTPGSGPNTSKSQKAKYDFTDEKVHFEGAPHRGDLVTNLALGATLLWLPLTAAAVGRGAFVKYRITDKRISVITSAPWKKEQLDAAYQEVDDVKTVGRGLGFWGDMVVTLKNGDKIELRSLPKFMEMRDYIRERRDAMANAPPIIKGQKGFA